MIRSTMERMVLGCAIAALAVLQSPSAEAIPGPVLVTDTSGGSAFAGDAAFLTELSNLGFTPTFVSDAVFQTLAPGFFNSFTSIYIGYNYALTLAPQSAALNAFVIGGGHLFAETENAINYANLPFAAGVFSDNSSGDSVTIVDPGSPFAAGLTDAGMSNWLNTYHGTFVANGVLSSYIDGASGTVALGGQFGAGSVVYTTLDPTFHILNGSGPIGAASEKGTFILNALDPAAPELNASASAVPLSFVAIALLALLDRRRKRQLMPIRCLSLPIVVVEEIRSFPGL